MLLLASSGHIFTSKKWKAINNSRCLEATQKLIRIYGREIRIFMVGLEIFVYLGKNNWYPRLSAKTNSHVLSTNPQIKISNKQITCWDEISITLFISSNFCFIGLINRKPITYIARTFKI